MLVNFVVCGLLVIVGQSNISLNYVLIDFINMCKMVEMGGCFVRGKQ